MAEWILRPLQVRQCGIVIGLWDEYICSNCEELAYYDSEYEEQLFKYCPYCGAKMDNPRE